MNVPQLPLTLYRHAELLCGLVIASCGAVLMAVAANPGVAAITSASRGTTVVYAEFSLMGAVIAVAAVLHARRRGQVARTALWFTTALWWLASALLFDLSPVFGLMGTVATLACVSSLATQGDALELSPFREARGFRTRVPLYGASR